MLTATRLTYRINRFEIRAILAATILSAVVTAAILSWMTSSGYASCITYTDTPSVACLNLMGIGSWAAKIESMSMNLVPVFPFLAGLLLGGPIIARELDRGTARLAWSLGPSRMRWLAQRVLPIVAIAVVACFAVGVIGDRIVALFAPDADLANSFVQFHQRGVLIATNGFLIVSVAIAVGAVVGRTVPTLLLALLMGGVCLVAIAGVDHKLLINEAVPLTENSGNDLQIDSRFQLPDGRLVTWDELMVIDPAAMESPEGIQYPYVPLGIPGSRYREIETREGLIEIAFGLAFLGLGAFVVSRRRPG